MLPDVAALRRLGISALRYQYTRNIGSARFTSVVRWIAGSPEAAGLWARHEIAFPPHQHVVRITHRAHVVDAQWVRLPIGPALWLFAVVLPPSTRRTA